jgi:mRNA-degrading endonuclease RelE of RelBE toxin-antitoxin system
MERRTIQWTDTAKECLAKLPQKVRRGLLDKADILLECTDPKTAFKPLEGALEGYYRITYARYRAIYSVEEESLVSGDVLVHIVIRFVAAGIRKEGDKKDIYNFAMKLIKLKILDPPTIESDEE